MTFILVLLYSSWALASTLPPGYPQAQDFRGVPPTGVLWAPPPISNRKSRLGKSKLERGCALVKGLRG